jgi:hypothetical protein
VRRAGRCAARLQVGEKKASLWVCSVGADCSGIRLGGQLARGEELQQVASGSSGGVSGRAGRAEASAADDLLEFARWEAVGGSPRPVMRFGGC